MPNDLPLGPDEYWVVELTDCRTKQRRLAMPNGSRAFRTIHQHEAEEYASHIHPELYPVVRRARISVELLP